MRGGGQRPARRSVSQTGEEWHGAVLEQRFQDVEGGAVETDQEHGGPGYGHAITTWVCARSAPAPAAKAAKSPTLIALTSTSASRSPRSSLSPSPYCCCTSAIR